jgi:hypothetical protein
MLHRARLLIMALSIITAWVLRLHHRPGGKVVDPVRRHFSFGAEYCCACLPAAGFPCRGPKSGNTLGCPARTRKHDGHRGRIILITGLDVR